MTKQQLMLHVRNFLCPLTMAQMERELEMSIEMTNWIRAECVNDYINERICEDHVFLMRGGSVDG